jgi:hypothetical protein
MAIFQYREAVNAVAEALQKTATGIWGGTWSPDNAEKLARAALDAMPRPEETEPYKKLLADEHALSAAYLRLRQKIPGALGWVVPPHVFKRTEDALDNLLEAVAKTPRAAQVMLGDSIDLKRQDGSIAATLLLQDPEAPRREEIMGGLRAEMSRFTDEARKAGDTRAVAVATYLHDLVCVASRTISRDSIVGEKWAEKPEFVRDMTDGKKPITVGTLLNQIAKHHDNPSWSATVSDICHLLKEISADGKPTQRPQATRTREKPAPMHADQIGAPGFRTNAEAVAVMFDPNFVLNRENRTSRAQAIIDMFDREYQAHEWLAINKLREGEGDSITLICDKPDFGPGPEAIVTFNGHMTEWADRTYEGECVLEALQKAVADLDAFNAKLRANPPLRHKDECATNCEHQLRHKHRCTCGAVK